MLSERCTNYFGFQTLHFVIPYVFFRFVFYQQLDVCKQAYRQEDIDTAEDSDISPRDVGHNVYILAYQVYIDFFHTLHCNASREDERCV